MNSSDKILKREGVIIIMKYLLIFLFVFVLLFNVGCFSVPDVPDVPDVNPDIICEGGFYTAYYQEWTLTGCPGDWHEKGTYWYNPDGRVFLISYETPFDPYIATELVDYFGECPTEYIEEIFLE